MHSSPSASASIKDAANLPLNIFARSEQFRQAILESAQVIMASLGGAGRKRSLDVDVTYRRLRKTSRQTEAFARWRGGTPLPD